MHEELLPGCRPRSCLAPLGTAAVGAGSWAWRKSRRGGRVGAGTLVLPCLCQRLCISYTSDSKDQLIWKPAGRQYLCYIATSGAMVPWRCGMPDVLRAAGGVSSGAGRCDSTGWHKGWRESPRQAAGDWDSPAQLGV